MESQKRIAGSLQLGENNNKTNNSTKQGEKLKRCTSSINFFEENIF